MERAGLGIRKPGSGDPREEGEGCHGHARQDRDPHSLGDEVLDGDVVVGLEGDVGDEAGAGTRFEKMTAALRAPGDPTLVRETREVDRPRRRGVVDRQDQDGVVSPDRPHREAVRGEIELATVTGIAVGEGDVGAILPHRDDRLGRLRLDEADRDAGTPRGHRRDHPRHDGRRGRGEGRDPHPPRAEAPQLGEIARRRLERGGDDGCVPGEHAPRLGQAHTPTDAFDDRGPGATFEPTQLLTDRRLAVPQRMGGRRDRARVGDGFHHAERVGIEVVVGVRHVDT
ncbi:MAG: hypothetical protein K0R81_2156 [Microbacterium sp.]|nr:hypothetical protein [Microbacterium sp.]